MAYYVILTTAGQAALANAVATENPLEIASFVVGDSNGVYYEPTEGQTALVHQVWSGTPNKVYTHPNNANWIVVEAIIPTTAGGFDIREAGVKDAGGTLIAIGKYPLTNKPAPGSGSEKDLYVRMIMQVTNAASVSQTIDPSLVMATQEYVDRKNVRESCRVATTANITLSGLQAIDGVTVVANDRVLVKNQTTGSANGIYVAGTGSWTRALDADNALEVVDTMMVPVREGTANGESLWMLTTNAPITLGTTALTFRPVCGPLITSVQEQTGTGLIAKTAAATAAMRTITGTTGRVVVANGNGVSGNPTIDLATSGVTAGTYNTVTVDVYGRATGGSNVTASTTVAGAVELATTAEAIAGTDTARAVTPAGLAANAGASTPLMDGTAAVGISTRHARDDHRHPTDTSRQPVDALLTALADLATAADRIPYFTGVDTVGLTTLTSFARTLLDDTDAATMRATLGLVIGSNVQAYDALLTALAALTTSSDKMPYFTGTDAVALTSLTAFARTLLDDTSAAAALTTLGVSSYIQTLLNDTDAATARSTLGCGDVAPMTVATNFASSLSANGYQKLPSGLIFQWSSITRNISQFVGTYSFPLTFPTACFGVIVPLHSYGTGFVNGYQLRGRPISSSQFYLQEDNYNLNGEGQSATVLVMAIGS